MRVWIFDQESLPCAGIPPVVDLDFERWRRLGRTWIMEGCRNATESEASKLLQHGSKARGEVIGLEGQDICILKIISTCSAASAACRLRSSFILIVNSRIYFKALDSMFSVAVLHLPRSWRRPLLCRRFGIEQLAGILFFNLRSLFFCKRWVFARQKMQTGNCKMKALRCK